MEVLPKKTADACKVGLGRDDPNNDPYLPPPIGRMQWSWNPYTLIVMNLLIFYYLFLVSIYST